MFALRAAGLATGCKVQITPLGEEVDVRQNKTLGEKYLSIYHNGRAYVIGCEVAHIITSKYGAFEYKQGAGNASTDFVCRISPFLLFSVIIFNSHRDMSHMVLAVLHITKLYVNVEIIPSSPSFFTSWIWSARFTWH